MPLEQLEALFPLLAEDERVQEAIEDEFGEESETILGKLRSQQPLSDHEPRVHDLIVDLVGNKSEVAEVESGLGSAGELPISVMQFGPVFWISAPEFDDIGYFRAKDDALTHAQYNFGPFISELEEQVDEEE